MAGIPTTEADEKQLRLLFGDLYAPYDEAYPGGEREAVTPDALGDSDVLTRYLG